MSESTATVAPLLSAAFACFRNCVLYIALLSIPSCEDTNPGHLPPSRGLDREPCIRQHCHGSNGSKVPAELPALPEILLGQHL